LVKIRILDISGKLIQKEQQMKAGQILKVPITLENLKSGVHMVEISIGDQRVVKRIIKN
ncbi:MAG: T9SS type A sorting domain-containing protein, partial [Cytophagales bacterium]|nr:T9SS type A sorting domain-containing protein [Cytophagales bacterium]MCP4457354.1 T9SS type A sorting domain-containing protein [Cytophagales bacterium]